jgi:hypothetical protein
VSIGVIQNNSTGNLKNYKKRIILSIVFFLGEMIRLISEKARLNGVNFTIAMLDTDSRIGEFY